MEEVLIVTTVSFYSITKSPSHVKIKKYWHQNMYKVPKVKVLIMQNVPFQNKIHHITGL